MKQARFTNKIVIVATILASLFTLFFGFYEYRREHAFRVDILHSQLQLNNYHYLENQGERYIRVTVIDTLGNVLSDTEEKDISRMGNHQEREEIQKALQCGSGYAIFRRTHIFTRTRLHVLVLHSQYFSPHRYCDVLPSSI